MQAPGWIMDLYRAKTNIGGVFAIEVIHENRRFPIHHKRGHLAHSFSILQFLRITETWAGSSHSITKCLIQFQRTSSAHFMALSEG